MSKAKSKRVIKRPNTAKLRRIRSKVTNKLKEEPLISKAKRWEKELLNTIAKVHQLAHEDYLYLKNKVRKLKKAMSPAMGKQKAMLKRDIEKAKHVLTYLTSQRKKMNELKKWFRKLQRSWEIQKPKKVVKSKVRRKVRVKKAVRSIRVKTAAKRRKSPTRVKIRSARRKSAVLRRKPSRVIRAKSKARMQSKSSKRR